MRPYLIIDCSWEQEAATFKADFLFFHKFKTISQFHRQSVRAPGDWGGSHVTYSL